MIKITLWNIEEKTEFEITLPNINLEFIERLNESTEIRNVEYNDEDIFREESIENDLIKLNEIALYYENLDKEEKIVLSALFEYNRDFDEARERFEEGCTYYTDIVTREDLAREALEQGLFGLCCTCYSEVIHYIDFEQLGHDLEFDFYIAENGIAIHKY